MATETKDISKTIPSDLSSLSALFSNKLFSIVWLIVRVYVGWSWLEAGWHKVTGTGYVDGGLGLKGFWDKAASIPAAPAKPAITYDWYRGFLDGLSKGGHYSWFGWLIAYGELLVGIALIIGAFVGVAAFFGALMNLNFMLAGTSSTNPMLFTLAILLMLSWKIAGEYGADRFILPTIGNPWEWPRTIPGLIRRSA